jgi:hypothetical protein
MHMGNWWGKPEGRPSHRWVDNIEMVLRDVGWGGMH